MGRLLVASHDRYLLGYSSGRDTGDQRRRSGRDVRGGYSEYREKCHRAKRGHRGTESHRQTAGAEADVVTSGDGEKAARAWVRGRRSWRAPNRGAGGEGSAVDRLRLAIRRVIGTARRGTSCEDYEQASEQLHERYSDWEQRVRGVGRSRTKSLTAIGRKLYNIVLGYPCYNEVTAASMIYPSADILENWGSKYSLVVLAAKRAKQLKSGAPPLINTSSRNPLTIALEEIAAGKVLCQVADHDILPKSTQEAEVAQLLAIPTLSTEEEGAAEEPVTAAVLADDTDLLLEEEEEEEESEEEEEPLGIVEEEEEEEHEVGFVEDIDEDEEAAVDVDAVDDEAAVAPRDHPRRGRAEAEGRRGRKPKVAPEEDLFTEEPEAIDSESEESEE